MKEYIITGIEPKTDRVRLFLYSEEGSIIKEVRLPHILPSRPISIGGGTRTVKEVLDILKEKGLECITIKTTNGIRIEMIQEGHHPYDVKTISETKIDETIELSRNKRIIQLAGPSSMKKELYDLNDVFPVGKRSKNGTDPRNNVTRIHRLQVGWPFSKVTLTDQCLQIPHRFPSIDELADLPTGTFDIEARGWEPAYTFTDLDVTEGVLRDYLREKLPKKVSSLEQDIDSLQEILLVLAKDDKDECQEMIEKSMISLESTKQERDYLDNLPRQSLVDLVKREKFDEAIYEPFAICYVTPEDQPNFYFSIYPMSERMTSVDTKWGTKDFVNIVIENTEQVDDALETLVASTDKGKRIREYIEHDKERIKRPSEAITLFFAATMRAMDPFITGGHNQGSYDFPNLRGEDRKKTFLKCGIQGEAPLIDANMGFLKRTRVPGFYYIDTLPLMINFVPGTKNNKLVTFTELLFGEKDFKDLDYAALTRNDIEASLGNIESSDRMAKYCMRDTFYSHMAVKAMKRSAFLLSRLLRQAPEVAISTNYKALSANLLQCQSLRQRGCYLDEQFGDFRSLVKKPSGIVVRTPSGSQIPLGKLSRDDLDIEKEKNRLLFGLVEQEVADVRSGEQMELFGAPKTKKTKKVVDPDLRQRLKTKTVTNKQAELVYLTPFVRAMYPFIDDHPYAREIIKEIADTPDTRIGRVNKLMLAQGLQRHYLGLRTHTALNFSPTRGHQKIPRQEYHPEAFIFEKLYNIRLEDINNHIADAKEQFQDAVKRFNIEIIDSATYTAITLPQEHRQKFIDWLHQERMGIYAGQAQVVSPSQSARFLFYQNGIVFGQGIDINFSRGLKNEYDKQVMDSILDAVFEKEDIGMVVDIVARSVADLRSGKVAFEQLLYVTTECKKDPEQYSARALKNRDTWEKIRAGVKKGDRFAWGYTHQGEKSMSDINQEDIDTDIYTRMMFGEKRKERWNFRTYQRSAEKRSRTTCGAIVESLLVYNTDEKELQEQKHRALARVVTDSQQGDEKAILTLS